MTREGRDLLVEFLEGWYSQREFAIELGVTPEMVNHILRGRRRPSLDLAFRIAELSDGYVPVSAWRCDDAAGREELDADVSGTDKEGCG